MKEITDERYAEALEAGISAKETEYRAYSVSYMRENDAIRIMTLGNRDEIVIPRRCVDALQNVNPDRIGNINLWPDGSIVEIDDFDIHLDVHQMVVAALIEIASPYQVW